MTDPIDDIMELFNINSGNKKLDADSDSNDYDVVAENSEKVSFDELVEDISLGDSLNSPKLEVVNNKEDMEVKEKVEKEKKEDAEEIIKEVIATKDDKVVIDNSSQEIDSIFGGEVSENKNEEESLKEDQEAPISPNVSGDLSEPVEKETVEDTTMTVEKVEKVISSSKEEGMWLLTSPTEKYNRFYEEKRDLLEHLLPYGEVIPFKEFEKELKQASIDLSGNLYDLESLFNKMRAVQMWRERIQEILLDINSQYFCWERSIEMLHGVLARIEYEKPVIRQEGVIYEHMRDFETYFCKLKGVHASAVQVSRTLEAAFDCFSRQLTIVQNSRETPVRYEQNNDNKQNKEKTSSFGASSKIPNKELEDFDSLDGVKEIAKPTAGGVVGWDMV